ncbi:hypothetical protein [Cerasicoccus fimbriatus]|uniref:hypothetical protein n=1 Tax=Cerasicoccus fimbriatus TaxID=3014554 RepID=UPI0022B3DCAD|nr:hypothetical protein [Cerasicoccus sp. TK19100]
MLFILAESYMFESFNQHYSVFKSKAFIKQDITKLPAVDQHFMECIALLGGKSYNYGLYQVFDEEGVLKETSILWEIIPKSRDRATAFGCDWLGRYFAIDADRMEDGLPLVLMVESDERVVYEVPLSVVNFHNQELVDDPENTLALSYFKAWRNIAERDLELSECLGYKIPLYLGGSDDESNLEIVDRETYLKVTS